MMTPLLESFIKKEIKSSPYSFHAAVQYDKENNMHCISVGDYTIQFSNYRPNYKRYNIYLLNNASSSFMQRYAVIKQGYVFMNFELKNYFLGKFNMLSFDYKNISEHAIQVLYEYLLELQ